MSFVYSIVIQTGFMAEVDDLPEKLNKYFMDEEKLGNKFKFIDSSLSAGTKFPDTKLLWAGINYLNVQEFVDYFKSLKLENSLLTIIAPEGERVKVVPSDIELEVE